MNSDKKYVCERESSPVIVIGGKNGGWNEFNFIFPRN